MSTSASIPGTQPLLLEIGCEEIPARFLAKAQRDLCDRLAEFLAINRFLEWPAGPLAGAGGKIAQSVGAKSFSTPRRLVAYFPRILAAQPDIVLPVEGPSVKVGVDAEGNFTRAAEGFARKQGATLADLKRVTTAKGEYLALEKRELGAAAISRLPNILLGLLWNLNFEKSMYWGDPTGSAPRYPVPLSNKFTFVRPIRWILALLGEGDGAHVVPFEVAGVKSGNQTYGHRLAGGGGIEVTGFDDYARELRAAHVEFDPENRRQTVRAELNVLLEDSLEAIPDEELADWIVNSTEWLSGIRGDFDKRFLHLPREILITVMRDHQKYFAVQDSRGNLQPHFIALLNRGRDATGTIRAGHERVLTARFSDAEFFWKADQKIPLRDRIPMLDRVTYQAKLGSYGDKVRRMEAIAKEICGTLEGHGNMSAGDAAHALQAVRLCKCDLTSQMVQEFTELQGIVGGLYAREQGEPAEVSDAIYDHYQPVGIADAAPRSVAGCVVSMADRIDSIVGAFRAGLEPTGSSDPFGVRRAGNGIIKILLETSTRLSLSELFGPALSAHDLDRANAPPEVGPDRLWSFFKERQEYYFEQVAKLRYDTVRAVLIQRKESDNPVDSFLRAKALERVRDTEDFASLAIAAKRTRNILDKSASDEDRRAARPGVIDPDLFEGDAERALYQWSEDWLNVQAEASSRDDYERLFRSLAEARPYVDRFFDSVMVMVERDDVRRNRLSLLQRLDLTVFRRFADLSQIESPTSISVDASTFKDQ